MVALTSFCFLALTQWHRNLMLPDVAQFDLSVHFIGGLLMCFLLNAVLLVVFIQRISRIQMGDIAPL